MAPVVVLAPPGNWGLLLRSCLRAPLASPRLGGAEDEGESWEAPPLPSVAGGRETTMYFWTLPEMGGLGAACAPETNFTRGCVLGTVLVTGEVEVLAWPPLSVITCESKRRSEKSPPARPPPCPPRRTCWEVEVPEAEDMTMNLVGGGEGCVGVAGRVETRVCTGRVIEPGTLMMLGARVVLLPPWAAWERVSVGRGCAGEERSRRLALPPATFGKARGDE